MNRRIMLWGAAALALAGGASAQDGAQDHGGHGYVGPSPGAMGGAFALRGLDGRAFTEANLTGAWTLLYFGYAACRSACPTALPAMLEALAQLDAAGIASRGVFVDIDAPAAPIRLRSQSASASAHDHGGDRALATLAAQFRPITFLTGSRAQLRQAFIAFRVRSEHVPPRTDLGEHGHSINHTSAIYMIGPNGGVAGYLRHDADPAAIVRFVRARS